MGNLTQIRMFEKKDEILKEFYQNTDQIRASELMEFCFHCYYYLRTDCLSLIITIPGIFMIAYVQPSVGMLALVLTNMIDVCHSIRDLIRIKGDFEHGFVSFERMLTYMSIDHEHGYKNLGKIEESYYKEVPICKEQNTTNFIKKGDLEFNNLFVKYKDNSPNVLNDVSLKIQGGQKNWNRRKNRRWKNHFDFINLQNIPKL